MNPYDPGVPASPESFAGRQALLATVEERLEKAIKWKRSSALLLYGYRGSGKTSALRKIGEVVLKRSPRALTAEIQPRAPLGDSALVGAISEEVQQAARRAPGLSSKVRATMKQISSISIMGTGVSVSGRRGERISNPMTVWRDTLEVLQAVPVIVVMIDDAEFLDTTGLGVLKTLAEMNSPVPIMLVVAGGLELLDRMSKHEYSPILRNFSGAMFDIGTLSSEETGEALAAPLDTVGSATKWTSEAVASVFQLTHGYPYLVQCLAQATFREDAVLRPSDVQAAIPKALSIGASWMEREASDASDEDIRVFVRIANLNQPQFKAAEAVRAGVPTIYLGRLTKRGILRKVSRGKYELRKAPVIAYYHALKRGLTV